MARHKPAPKPEVPDDCCGGFIAHKASCENAPRVDVPGMGSISKKDLEIEFAVEEARRGLTLAERLEQAKAKLAAAETVADACYWQGAVDAIEAYSAGWPMPETIGAGVKKS